MVNFILSDCCRILKHSHSVVFIERHTLDLVRAMMLASGKDTRKIALKKPNHGTKP
jgi:prophage antirepressor-like protein